jgi:hypothetical protein
MNNTSMKKENAVKIFEQKQVRTHWDEDQENGILPLLM